MTANRGFWVRESNPSGDTDRCETLSIVVMDGDIPVMRVSYKNYNRVKIGEIGLNIDERQDKTEKAKKEAVRAAKIVAQKLEDGIIDESIFANTRTAFTVENLKRKGIVK